MVKLDANRVPNMIRFDNVPNTMRLESVGSVGQDWENELIEMA